MFRKTLCLTIFILLLCESSFGFGFKKKKNNTPIEKMAETYQEWSQEAKSIPLSERKLELPEVPKTDKKNYFPAPYYTFEKYNYPQGSRELNIQFIKKNLVEHPTIVADVNCNYVAYVNYYYSSDIDMIYSDFFVEKLDIKKTRINRILEYNHKQEKRTPVITAGLKEQYKRLFRGLVVVDWSSNSKKILIKEHIGSTIYGIYRTYLYIYDLDKKQARKLDDFEKFIIEYYLNSDNINLKKYIYEIHPLGFSAENENVVLAHVYMFDKNNKKIFIGSWGYDTENNKSKIYSRTNPSLAVSANGLVLKRILK